jgi:hypothetical protein
MEANFATNANCICWHGYYVTNNIFKKILLNIYLKLTIQPNTLLLDNQVQTSLKCTYPLICVNMDDNYEQMFVIKKVESWLKGNIEPELCTCINFVGNYFVE